MHNKTCGAELGVVAVGRFDRGGREQTVQRYACGRQALELQEAVQSRWIAERRTGGRVTAEHQPAAVRREIPGGQRAVVGYAA